MHLARDKPGHGPFQQLKDTLTELSKASAAAGTASAGAGAPKPVQKQLTMTHFSTPSMRFSDPASLLADFADLTLRHTTSPVSLCDHPAMRAFVLSRMGLADTESAVKVAVFKGVNKVCWTAAASQAVRSTTIPSVPALHS